MSEEMLLRILQRLPSKSLMRFKCVHKSWYSLINKPFFLETHLSNTMHNNLSTCVLCKRFFQSDPNTGEKELRFSFLHLWNDYYVDGHEHINSVVEDIKFLLSTGRFVGLEVIEYPDIIGHCHGMICLSDCKGNLVLCNPAMKEIKLLPKPCHKIVDLVECAMGFGYDHKIPRIVSYGEEDLVMFPPRVEIYTLSTDSWREITNNYLQREATLFWPDYFLMYFQRICYWVGKATKTNPLQTETEKLKNLPMKIPTDFETIVYVNSLVSITRGN